MFCIQKLGTVRPERGDGLVVKQEKLNQTNLETLSCCRQQHITAGRRKRRYLLWEEVLFLFDRQPVSDDFTIFTTQIQSLFDAFDQILKHKRNISYWEIDTNKDFMIASKVFRLFAVTASLKNYSSVLLVSVKMTDETMCGRSTLTKPLYQYELFWSLYWHVLTGWIAGDPISPPESTSSHCCNFPLWCAETVSCRLEYLAWTGLKSLCFSDWTVQNSYTDRKLCRN